MTASKTKAAPEAEKNTFATSVIPTIRKYVALLLVIIGVIFSKEITGAVANGIRLSATSIIPAIFPFFILADFLTSDVQNENKSFFGRCFNIFFDVNNAGFSAFVCGMICGFPVGVKCAVQLYEQKAITKDECERLIGFVNNPSLAFVISGVGLGMYGSIPCGLILYTATVISSILTGILFAKKDNKVEISIKITRQKFNLVNSVKNAGISSVAVSSYIVFFSAILGAIGAISKNNILLALISPIFEVGNATNIISQNTIFSPLFSIMLTGFSLGFSGFSVHLQAFSLLPAELSKKRYLLMKILQGILCAALSAFLFALM